MSAPLRYKAAARFLPVRVSTPRFTPEYFLVFFTHGQTVCEYEVLYESSSQILHARSGRRTLASPLLFPPGASLVSQISSRGNGETSRRRRVSRSREPRFRARDRAHPPIAARGVLVLPSRDRGTAAQSPPLSSADARCVRVGATKWRAAPPPKRCDTERPSAVARPHPRLTTRAPSRPRDARRRCPDSIRPPNGSPRRPNVSTSKEVEEFRARETPRP